MTENVTIRLEMTHRLDGQAEISQYDYTGYGVKKAGGWFFSYKEQLEDELTVQTILKIGEDEASLLRQGGLQTKQLFKSGVKTQGIYQSPYGPFLMETLANRLEVKRQNERPVQVILQYQLWMNEQETGEYSMQLTFDWHEK